MTPVSSLIPRCRVYSLVVNISLLGGRLLPPYCSSRIIRLCNTRLSFYYIKPLPTVKISRSFAGYRDVLHCKGNQAERYKSYAWHTSRAPSRSLDPVHNVLPFESFLELFRGSSQNMEEVVTTSIQYPWHALH